MQQRLVNGIARCASHRTHYRALTADQFVQEARLTDIGPADNRDGDLALDVGAPRIFWECFESLNDHVKKVTRSDAVLRADGVKAIKPQDGELLGGAVTLNVVGFVCHKDDRLPATTKQLRHLSVARVRASCRVNKEQNQVGSVNRNARLVLYPNLNRIANSGLHAARVHHTKAHPVPLNDTDQPIAGSTGAILNHRTTLTNETIEEGALPNVRSPDQGHQW